jgi:hypothetical protein
MAGEEETRAYEHILSRKRNYQFTFVPAPGQAVLMDLADFCRANDTTFAATDRDSARLEGRREVWLRIQRHLNLNPEHLYTLATGRTFHNYNIEEKPNADELATLAADEHSA